jgi:hypothetical protein
MPGAITTVDDDDQDDQDDGDGDDQDQDQDEDEIPMGWIITNVDRIMRIPAIADHPATIPSSPSPSPSSSSSSSEAGSSGACSSSSFRDMARDRSAAAAILDSGPRSTAQYAATASKNADDSLSAAVGREFARLGIVDMIKG